MDTRQPDGEAQVSRHQRPVQAAVARLREMIFAHEPGTRIGSLSGLAEELGVGIVTVQQAARVLEHEGLLDVRRGPGGGYYGKRPDPAVLERSLAAYMRTDPATWQEALDMTSLLFNELVAAAAGCDDARLRAELAAFAATVDDCPDEAAMATMEETFQDLLFGMVNRPLFALLTRVTLRFSASRPTEAIYRGLIGLDRWTAGRKRIIAAILDGDAELARFEADRNNRRVLMRGMAAKAR